MSKRILTFLFAIVISVALFAQVPQSVSYQAVVRDADNNLVTNTQVGIQVQIWHGTLQDGGSRYSETQTPTTNENGLFSIQIGGPDAFGTGAQDDFTAIDWTEDSLFLYTEIDPDGGTTYTISSYTQLLSVPYALYAEECGNGFSGDYTDLDNTPDISGIANNTQAIQDTAAQIRADIPATPDLSIYATKDMAGANITNLAEPATDQDAATKAYVDALEAKLVELETLLEAYGAFTMVDIDGNQYNTIMLGDQIWSVENLKTTRLNDGTAIPKVENNTTWSNLTTPGYSYYANDSAASAKYGMLYNWYALENGNLCPMGWHVPTITEWVQLGTFLADNGYNYDGTTGGAGSKVAKAMATDNGWTSSTVEGSIGNNDYPEYQNKSGFSALPGGRRFDNGSFSFVNERSSWWTSNDVTATNGSPKSLEYNIASFGGGGTASKKMGCNIRCVKD